MQVLVLLATLGPMVGIAAPIWGVATNQFDTSNPGMTELCNAGMQYWWNWGFAPKMTYTAPCGKKTFVPMVWGFEDPAQISKIGQAAGAFSYLMGYNEPDHWGPPAKPGADVNSAGTFTVNFHCGSDGLAENWQAVVKSYLAANPNGKVVSPAMADATGSGSAGDYSTCNSATQDEQFHDLDNCAGWLKCFQKRVEQLECGATNCWDVISTIQLHAYEYASADVISKIQTWETAWADDINGVNNRSKKTLWLTEWAHAGTTDASDPDGKAGAFMTESINFMKSRPSVGGFSWFSEPNWPSFVIKGITPVSPIWTSQLIDPTTGQLTKLGQTYTTLVKGLGQLNVSNRLDNMFQV
jgi:hypothetical protein